MKDDSCKSTMPLATNSQQNSERRGVSRDPFIASAEETDLDSGARISASVSDLSLKGCYLDTLNPLPKGTQIRVVVSHGDVTFTALATVIYPQPNMGMGVEFSAVEPDQLEVLLKWVKELSRR